MRLSVLLAALLLTAACGGGETPAKDEPLTLGQSCPQVGLSLLDGKGADLERLRAAGQLSKRLDDLAGKSDAETRKAIRPLRLALTDMLDNDGAEAGSESAVDDAVAALRLDCQDAHSPVE